MSLLLCAACDRHFRPSSGACPFCGATFVVVEERTTVDSASRAALVFGGLALTSLMGCVTKGDVYGAPPPPPREAGPTTESIVAPYGAAPPPEIDAGAPFAIIYGAPPSAAEATDAATPKKVVPPKR